MFLDTRLTPPSNYRYRFAGRNPGDREFTTETQNTASFFKPLYLTEQFPTQFFPQGIGSQNLDGGKILL